MMLAGALMVQHELYRDVKVAVGIRKCQSLILSHIIVGFLAGTDPIQYFIMNLLRQ